MVGRDRLALAHLIVTVNHYLVAFGEPLDEFDVPVLATADADFDAAGRTSRHQQDAGLALAFTYGILWTLLYRNIKASRFGIVYDRLPALTILFRMQRRAVLFGWIALTVSIAIGFV